MEDRALFGNAESFGYVDVAVGFDLEGLGLEVGADGDGTVGCLNQTVVGSDSSG